MNHSSNSLPLVLGLAAGLGVVAYFLLIKNDPVANTGQRIYSKSDNSQSSQQQVGTITNNDTGYSTNPSQNQLTPNPPKDPTLKRGSEGTTDTLDISQHSFSSLKIYPPTSNTLLVENY